MKTYNELANLEAQKRELFLINCAYSMNSTQEKQDLISALYGKSSEVFGNQNIEICELSVKGFVGFNFSQYLIKILETKKTEALIYSAPSYD